jgi:hypothetical protein
MNTPRRYNWFPITREDGGTGLVLLAVLVVIVWTFIR